MDYYYLLVGQYEEKPPVDVQDRLSARPVKIGISSVSEKSVGQDKSYHSKNFKR
jgi:hypothetical protein